MIHIDNIDFTSIIEGNGRRFELKAENSKGDSYKVESATFSLPFSPNVLTYGAVSSANVSFKVKASPFSKGEVLNFKLYALTSAGTLDECYVKLGQYKITENKSSKEKHRISEITAYNRLNFVSGKYIPSQTGKRSISWLFADICVQIIRSTDSYGFWADDSEPAYIPYTGRMSESEIDASAISGYNLRDALGFVAGYAGCNVIVNKDGKIEMKPFSKVEYSLLNPDRITTPVLAEEDTVIQFLLAKTSDDAKITASSVTAPQDGIIFTNPIVDDDSLSWLLSQEDVLSRYRTGTVNQMLGDPRIEPGDCIPLVGFESENLNIPVMNLTFSFDGGLSAHIESFEPEQNENLTMAEKIDFSLKANSDASKYAQTALDFSSRINSALGLYTIEVVDSEGAKIIYLANDEDLNKATYIATMTAEGFAFTESWNNGEPVWTWGVDSKGTAIFKLLVANKITADMIDTTTLNVEVSNLADFTIKTPIIYSAGALNEDDKTLETYGVGIIKPQSSNYLTFYSGYTPIDYDSLSQEDKLRYKEEYKGTPLEYIKSAVDTLSRINFYVMSNGKMVARDAEIEGSIYAVNSDKTKAVRVKDGEITLGAKKTTDADFSAFGRISSEINPFFTGTFNKYLRIRSDDVGVMLSNDYDINSDNIQDSKHWLNATYYILYNKPQSVGLFTDVTHYFAGNAGFEGILNTRDIKILGKIDGNLTTSGNIVSEGFLQSGGAFYSRGQYIMSYSNSGNVVIGSSEQGTVNVDGTVTGGNTNIYARTGKDIQFGNRAYFLLGANMAANQFIQIANNDAFGYSTKTVSFTDGSSKTISGLLTGIDKYNHYIFGTVLFPSGSAITSDREFKTQIESFTEIYESFFLALRPRTFKYKNGTSGRTHFGFIAQELEEAIKEVGLSTQDVAAFIETKNDKDKPEIKAIRYTDIISLNTHMIQKCLMKISELEKRIKALKGVE